MGRRQPNRHRVKIDVNRYTVSFLNLRAENAERTEKIYFIE